MALGAALYAAYKGDQNNLSPAKKHSTQKFEIAYVTSKSLGILVGPNIAQESENLVNKILIRKGERIPCSATETFFTVREGQDCMNFKITESAASETDPRFVNVIWDGILALPPGRPANQVVSMTISYDENQFVRISAIDVATGRKVSIYLSYADSPINHNDKNAKTDYSDEIEKFTVK